MLILYRYEHTGRIVAGDEQSIMNKLGILLGIVVVLFVLATAPMPLIVSLENPTRNVTIYPNLLFAVPLTLLGALLLLYGAVAESGEPGKHQGNPTLE
jgi:peptidoglycan/LPS O-acetylase OafA/YrhL